MKLSEAIAAGIGVGWPGPRHGAYPAYYAEGRWVRLIDDTCYAHAAMTQAEIAHCPKCDGTGYRGDR